LISWHFYVTQTKFGRHIVFAQFLIIIIIIIIHHPGWCIVILLFHYYYYSSPQKLPHTKVDIPTKFHEAWWKEYNNFLNPPFFVSMATAAKFIQPIPMFLAYLVPLDVGVRFASELYSLQTSWNFIRMFPAYV
jgi:hypothetical protein